MLSIEEERKVFRTSEVRTLHRKFLKFPTDNESEYILTKLNIMLFWHWPTTVSRVEIQNLASCYKTENLSLLNSEYNLLKNLTTFFCKN